MLKVLMMSAVALAFAAKKAHAALLHFECTGTKDNGEPCNKMWQISDGKGQITTCTRCGAKYTFKDGNVLDEDGNVVDTW